MPVIQRIRYLAFKWEALALLVFGRKAAAAAVFDRMLAEFPRDAYAMASKAHLLVQSGDRGQALQLLQALVQDEPGSAHHWFNYGFMLEEAG